MSRRKGWVLIVALVRAGAQFQIHTQDESRDDVAESKMGRISGGGLLSALAAALSPMEPEFDRHSRARSHARNRSRANHLFPFTMSSDRKHVSARHGNGLRGNATAFGDEFHGKGHNMPASNSSHISRNHTASSFNSSHLSLSTADMRTSPASGEESAEEPQLGERGDGINSGRRFSGIHGSSNISKSRGGSGGNNQFGVSNLGAVASANTPKSIRLSLVAADPTPQSEMTCALVKAPNVSTRFAFPATMSAAGAAAVAAVAAESRPGSPSGTIVRTTGAMRAAPVNAKAWPKSPPVSLTAAVTSSDPASAAASAAPLPAGCNVVSGKRCRLRDGTLHPAAAAFAQAQALRAHAGKPRAEDAQAFVKARDQGTGSDGSAGLGEASSRFLSAPMAAESTVATGAAGAAVAGMAGEAKSSNHGIGPEEGSRSSGWRQLRRLYDATDPVAFGGTIRSAEGSRANGTVENNRARPLNRSEQAAAATVEAQAAEEDTNGEEDRDLQLLWQSGVDALGNALLG